MGRSAVGAPGFVALMRLFDLLVIGGSLWLFCWALGASWQAVQAVAAGCAAALFLLVGEKRGLYRSWRAGGLRQEIGQLLIAWGTAAAILITLVYATGTTDAFPRRLVLAWFATVTLVLPCSRVAIRHLARRARATGRNQRTAAIAGAGRLGVRIARTMLSASWMGLRLDGLYDDRRRPILTAPEDEAMPVRGSLDQLVERSRKGEVDVIYLALPPRAASRMKDLILKLADTPASVLYVPDLTDIALLRSLRFTSGAIPTISIFENPLEDFERLLKRVEDILLSLLFLCAAAIPMLLIALGVKLSSRGPAIFKQRRHGLDGREIVVYKFRTMSVCECGDDARQAREGDPRVTRFGAFLRTSSLDELPQLLNVLQGRMSIVGPRPHPLPLNQEHRDRIDWYMLRQRIKPGITGWAQVNGYRGETDTLEKMQGRIDHDLQYINDWSIWFDLKIVMLTLVRGFVGPTAY